MKKIWMLYLSDIHEVEAIKFKRERNYDGKNI